MRAKGYRIPNWGEFQHYKDRCPPWIKLHRSLLDSYEFSLLPDQSKAHLMLIWLLASQHQGVIPADPHFLSRKLGLTERPDLALLEKAGFLEAMDNGEKDAQEDALQDVEQRASTDASNVLADCKQSARWHPRSEEKRREEKNAEKPPPPAAAFDPVKEMFDIGVSILTGAGKSESSARSLIGRIRGEVGDERAVQLLIAARKTTDPAAYIVKASMPKPRKVQLC